MSVFLSVKKFPQHGNSQYLGEKHYDLYTVRLPRQKIAELRLFAAVRRKSRRMLAVLGVGDYCFTTGGRATNRSVWEQYYWEFVENKAPWAALF